MIWIGRALAMVGLGGVSPTLLLAGVLVATAAIAGGVVMIDHNGFNRAQARCDAAALRARVAELQGQLNNANQRADRAARVNAELQESEAQNQERLAVLQKEVEDAKLQSTQPGAKKDANALLDDHCNLTERGAGRMRGGR